MIKSMAGAILSSMLSMINGFRLQSPSLQPCKAIDENLNKLEAVIVRLQALVSNVEKKGMQDECMKHWLQELKHTAYDAEDMLEDYEYEVQERSMVCGSTQFPFLDGIVSRMHDIVERFHLIECQLHDLDNTTKSSVEELGIYGRDEDRKRVIELILENNKRELCVIPIVGNGGVGKTTLAQIVYQDSLACKYFDAKGWVCVSEDFDLVRLMNAILAPFSEIQCVDSDLALLRVALRQRLEGKRYLLVLDDVRNEDERLWESLTASLRIGLQGSTILVTTCSESVAKMVMTVSYYYHLEPLREQQIWSLFQTFAFGNEYLMADTKLVSIGKEISKKFEGIPLAAKMLGECLRDETSKKKWLDILLSDFWGHEDRQGAVPPALFLSYLYLPVQLKRCFSYCALFPRDNFFDKEKLIQLWMAEGFLQPTEGKRMEDMGADYFDELLRRSFLQYSPADQCRFVMHDLVHKLAEIVASDDICRLDKGSMSSVSCKARHTSFILQDSTTSVKICSSNERKGLRTFLVIHRLLNTCSVSSPLSKSRLHLRIENNIFNNLQCLRTLDLSETDIIRLPDSIDKLIHLHYLGLNHTKIQNLPESVCNLYKLQTIEMLHCGDLIKLPRGITNLRNLRHLCVFLYAISTPMPKGFGSLTNLQTLSNFCVGTDKEHCEITELKDLVNLRGELCVSGLENITNANDAKGVLEDKENIKKLILHSGVISRYTNERLDTSLFDEPSDNNEILQPSTDDFLSFVMEQKPNPEEESVFESLKPHINLKELVIQSYQGVRFPNWIADPSFYNLVSIKLDICSNCKALPPLGQLPSLQDLVIEQFSELECISPEFLSKDYFPSLRTLYFGSMYKWEDWFGEDNAAAFPCLSLLDFNFCPKLKRMPNIFFSLKKLVLWACDKLTALPCLPSLTCLELRGHCNENIWSSMPQDLLARLQTLKINRYKDLCSFPVHQLLELKELEIYGGCPESTMPSSSLGMVFHRLVFLEKLKIQSCPGILFLPDQELPPMLQILDILHCPLLAEWCQGHGRNKLARIPRVIIDRKDFHPIDSRDGKHVD